MDLLGFKNHDELKNAHRKWVQGIAVGSKTFIEEMKEALGVRASGRKIIYADDTFELREVRRPYGKAENQDAENTVLWDQPRPA